MYLLYIYVVYNPIISIDMVLHFGQEHLVISCNCELLIFHSDIISIINVGVKFNLCIIWCISHHSMCFVSSIFTGTVYVSFKWSICIMLFHLCLVLQEHNLFSSMCSLISHAILLTTLSVRIISYDVCLSQSNIERKKY